MAPSAERSIMTEQQHRAVPPPVRAGPPDKNVAVAMNFEVALVDQFLADTRKRRRKDSETDAPNPIEEQPASNSDLVDDGEREEKKEMATEAAPELAIEAAQGDDSAGINRRMSMRDKGKRGANLVRTRIRYDFQMVPTVRRNNDFLSGFARWWMREEQALDRKHGAAAPPRENTSDAENNEPENRQVVARPFRDDSTVVWIPSKRSDWEDCVSEMTAVCTQAAIRRYTPGAPFIQPLSTEYIRDRIDIDDPQLGYQLRHRQGGWLQGFILFTNFTTWNLGFRWDSRHPASGIPASNGILVDRDGSLSAELESQHHSGDTNAGGVVFPTVAEISLLGGLGCGEYLLRMALDDIRARGNYKFVVLQATTMSRPFYERFGFVRVGAICYFRKQVDNVVPLVGYRHWTHANESKKSLEKHGGPSYMMCLKLSSTIPDERSFLQSMLDFKVEEKPLVENLGCGSGATPVPKSARKAAPVEAAANADLGDVMSPNVPKRKKTGPKSGTRTSEKLPAVDSKKKSETGKKGKKRAGIAIGASEEPTPKRQKGKTGRPRGRPPKSTTKTTPGTESSSQKRTKSTAKKKTNSSKKKKSSDAAITSDSPDKNRIYHSIRGPDGRFIRVLMDQNHQVLPNQGEKRKRGRPPGSGKKQLLEKQLLEKQLLEKEKAKVAAVAVSEPDVDTHRTSFVTSTKAGSPLPVDAKKLKKQKVVSYPRDRPHYFNKVVRHKDGRRKLRYYFVLEFDETTNMMCLVPMRSMGTLSGLRAGRPRYTCSFRTDDANFEIVPADDYEIIPATMIMKTPLVASEAWDIEEFK